MLQVGQEKTGKYAEHVAQQVCNVHDSNITGDSTQQAIRMLMLCNT